jgi:hypothetical protein
MKPIFLLSVIFISLSAFAQNKQIEMTHYIFPEFTKGIVKMHAGGTNTPMLNYNSLTEEMIFESNGKKLAMDKLNDIDTIYIEGRIFIPYQKKFIELIHKNKYELFVNHKCSLIDPGKPAAYGGTSQTSASTAFSSFSSGGQLYELSLPDGYTTKPYTEYLLLKDGKYNPFLTIKQLSKMFEAQAASFKTYTKSHKVKYEDQESIVELIRFMEQQ